MKNIAFLDRELTVEERSLFSSGYKNVIGAVRSSWRIVSSAEEKEKSKGKAANVALTRKYRQNLEDEITSICEDVLDVLDKHLIPSATSGESIVFYAKMQVPSLFHKTFLMKVSRVGDYHRYLSEFGVDDRRKGSVEKSLAAYKDALNVAVAELPPTSPLRLGLALNFSVFCYEILESHDRAVNVAQQAFDDALARIDDLPEDEYKDSTLIMELLRDNINLWTSDNNSGMFYTCDIVA